jgi:hypothetical protein
VITFPTKTATIAGSAAVSDAIELGGGILSALIMPGTWTAADITIQASVDGTNYYDVFDPQGTQVSITATASKFIPLSAGDNFSMPFIKLRSATIGTLGTPVNQAAERVITLVIR